MADTQAQNPTGTENTETQGNENITQADLNAKIYQLGELEKMISFTSDGKIGGSSNDSLIDKKYNEAINKTTPIRQKIEIVNQLILYFENVNNRIDSNEDMFQQDISPKVQKETQEIKEKIKEKVKELSQKYPEYTADLETYINKNLEYTSATVRYNEDHHDIKSLNIVLPILYTALEENLQIFENAVIQLNNIPQITDKVGALHDFIEEDSESKIINLSELFTIDFIKEGFGDGGEGNDTTFDIWGLIALSELDIDQVKILSQLYNNPTKHSDLTAYIESLPIILRKHILKQVTPFRNRVSQTIQERLDLQLGKNKNNEEIQWTGIQMTFLSTKIEKEKIYPLIKRLINEGTQKDFDIFFSLGGEFQQLILNTPNRSDQFYLKRIFESIYQYKFPKGKEQTLLSTHMISSKNTKNGYFLVVVFSLK